MKLYKVIIVGSGPAGAAAAIGLKKCSSVLMLDVGNQPKNKSKYYKNNFYSYKKPGSEGFEFLIGNKFESLNNISKDYLMPKLKSPLMRFVTESDQNFGEILSENFNAKLSFSKGGLANAWGSQLLRYDDNDLSGFPIDYKDLEGCYDEIEKEIGISGSKDDLFDYFGESENIMAPVLQNKISSEVISKYKKKERFFS